MQGYTWFMWCWELSLGLYTCQTEILLTNPHPGPCCLLFLMHVSPQNPTSRQQPCQYPSHPSFPVFVVYNFYPPALPNTETCRCCHRAVVLLAPSGVLLLGLLYAVIVLITGMLPPHPQDQWQPVLFQLLEALIYVRSLGMIHRPDPSRSFCCGCF